MRDVSASSRRAREAIEEGLEVTVYERHARVYYHRTYAPFYRHIDAIRITDVKFNWNVLMVICKYLEIAEIRPIDASADIGGRYPFRLIQPGCRAYLTHTQIADELGCSTETVREAIKRFREAEIIVNWGPGWLELDAEFFWKGNEGVRIAYSQIQRRRLSDRITVI